jgi:tetratricopeptide (TPR) repeat protein
MQQAVAYRALVGDYRHGDRSGAIARAARLSPHDVEQILAGTFFSRNCPDVRPLGPQEVRAAALLEGEVAASFIDRSDFDQMTRHFGIARQFLLGSLDDGSFTARWHHAFARRLRLAGLVSPWAAEFLAVARADVPDAAPIFVESGIVAELSAAGAANVRIDAPFRLPTPATRTMFYQRTVADGIGWLRHAATLDNAPMTRLHLARLLLAANKTPAATAILDGIIAEAPRSRPSYVARLLLGGALEREGHLDAALRLYSEARDVCPDAQSSYFASSAVLLRQGSVDEARQGLHNVATTGSPDSDDPWWEYLFDAREDVLRELDALREEVRP